MEIIADILLVAGALGAGFYCFILARRLTKFTDLENGVGGAVAVLSAQVDDLGKTLNQAQKSAGDSSKSLSELTERAEDVARRLELLVASMHDLPQSAGNPIQTQSPPRFKKMLIRSLSATLGTEICHAPNTPIQNCETNAAIQA